MANQIRPNACIMLALAPPLTGAPNGREEEKREYDQPVMSINVCVDDGVIASLLPEQIEPVCSLYFENI